MPKRNEAVEKVESHLAKGQIETNSELIWPWSAQAMTPD
jgi:hypothetical protein